jgi:hypothetical protein
MPLIVRIVLIAIITIIIMIMYHWVIYNYTGWLSFSMKANENFIIGLDPVDVKKLLFKDVIYNITSSAGKIINIDVSSVLNRMVSAYANNKDKNATMKLSDPGLCESSFSILNYDPTLDEWKNYTNISLNGKYKLT